MPNSRSVSNVAWLLYRLTDTNVYLCTESNCHSFQHLYQARSGLEATLSCGPRGQQQSSVSNEDSSTTRQRRKWQSWTKSRSDVHLYRNDCSDSHVLLLLLTRKAHILSSFSTVIGEASPSPPQFALISARRLKESVWPHGNVNSLTLLKSLVCALEFIINWSRN